MSEISTLVERFERNRDAYLSGAYNETQLRREFVDPFFTALGWDVDNKQGFAEAYKDVIHEDAIKIGGYTKAPDYCFRIGGARKFFVEAKKPAVNLKDEISPAFQLRRYAWSAKLPLSILTDFEEFAVYDCRQKPAQSDKPAAGRTLYLRYTDYEAKWEEIGSIFSKDAVLKGSFDKYAEANKAKKGTAEVDAAFLKEIENWRDLLARNLALRNPDLTQPELNFAVQRTIDRMIFLRICEDRGIENYGALQALLNGERVYKRLCEIFHRADERYNSGIFHFQKEKDRREEPDELTLGLKVDDKPLQEIIRNLYYPDSPYEFSVLPADILGQVYEQFLGKVIRLTSGHRAVVEDKPEVKKAGGVYYTPTYIVDYIVKNTVGKLLEGKTPKQVAKLRILDPACGSGSFLIGAYQYLLDWHRDWYVNDGPEKHATGKQPALFQAAKGDWRLTTTERKRILLNNIFGVDIDPQAVEVTKLSLLLKVLEGENAQTISQQLKFFHERALPDLGNNIKCGNSLIGPDFYEQQMNLLDDEERLRINAFDWQAEFPEIMKAGGLDVVIGNPPYLGGREWKEEGGRRYDYFAEKYQVAEYQFDIYALFWEQGIKLLRQNGLIGFITPNTWLNNQSNTKLREYILKNASVISITDYSREQVFHKAIVLPIISILKKASQPYNKVTIYRADRGIPQFLHSIPEHLWATDDHKIFNIDLREGESEIRAKIESGKVKLQSIAEVKFGIKLYETGKGTPPQKASFAKEHVYEAVRRIDSTYRKYLEGKDIQRYQILWQSRWLKYGPNLAAPRDPTLFEGNRLLIRRIVGERLIGTFTDEGYVTSQLLQIVKPHDSELAKFILGLLNSSLMAYYFKKKYNRQDKTFPEIRIYELASLPIRAINFSDPADKSRHDRMVELVERMLALHQQLAAAKITHEQTALQRQIEATDRQIDALVYELYGLTAEEIKIVEGRE